MSDATASRRIDLDAARAARAEKKGPAPVVVLAGVEFTLPPELPAEVIALFGQLQHNDIAALTEALKALFGQRWDEFTSLGLSWDDEQELLTQLLSAYGFGLPESSASAVS